MLYIFWKGKTSFNTTFVQYNIYTQKEPDEVSAMIDSLKGIDCCRGSWKSYLGLQNAVYVWQSTISITSHNKNQNLNQYFWDFFIYVQFICSWTGHSESKKSACHFWYLSQKMWNPQISRHTFNECGHNKLKI